MNKKSQSNVNFFVISFIFFLIFAISITAFLYLFKDNKVSEFFNNDETEEEVYVPRDDIVLEISTNAKTPVTYRIKQANDVVVEDIIEPNIKEKFLNAIFNTTYKIEAFGDDYYYNYRKILVLTDEKVNIDLKQKGNVSFEFVNSNIMLTNQFGVIQEPLICVAWTYEIYVVRIPDLRKYQIPNRLRKYVDICYNLDRDIDTDLTYYVDVRRIENKVAKITFYLVDKEVNHNGIPTYEEDTGIPDFIYNVQI